MTILSLPFRSLYLLLIFPVLSHWSRPLVHASVVAVSVLGGNMDLFAPLISFLSPGGKPTLM